MQAHRRVSRGLYQISFRLRGGGDAPTFGSGRVRFSPYVTGVVVTIFGKERQISKTVFNISLSHLLVSMDYLWGRTNY